MGSPFGRTRTSSTMPRTSRQTALGSSARFAAPKIQRRAGHERFETTLQYIRIAETLDAHAFGVPFPRLPSGLIENASVFRPPGRNRESLNRTK